MFAVINWYCVLNICNFIRPFFYGIFIQFKVCSLKKKVGGIFLHSDNDTFLDINFYYTFEAGLNKKKVIYTCALHFLWKKYLYIRVEFFKVLLFIRESLFLLHSRGNCLSKLYTTRYIFQKPWNLESSFFLLLYL